MYNLYKLDEDFYYIHSTFVGEKSKQGSLLTVLTYAVYVLGFSPNELQNALLDMLDEDHDVGHFGINRTFIYSFDRKTKKVG